MMSLYSSEHLEPPVGLTFFCLVNELKPMAARAHVNLQPFSNSEVTGGVGVKDLRTPLSRLGSFWRINIRPQVTSVLCPQ